MRITPIEEVEKVNNLVLDYQKTNNIAKRNDAIILCCPIFKMTASIMSNDRKNSYEDYNDLYQESSLIAMHCCDKFDISKCGNFFAYVTNTIRVRLKRWFPAQKMIRYKGGRGAEYKLKYLSIPEKHSDIQRIVTDTGLKYNEVLEYAVLKVGQLDEKEEWCLGDDDPSYIVEEIKRIEWVDEQLTARLSDKHIRMLLEEPDNNGALNNTTRTTNMRSRNKLKEAAVNSGWVYK